MRNLLSDEQLLKRIFDHIDNNTTDMGHQVWQEPSENYTSQARYDDEVALLRRSTIPFCPTATLKEKGSYVARKAAGTPILVTRGLDNKIRAFINRCRHRGMPVAKGLGCTRALVCPYHAWTYSLDGQLKYIADKQGFPGLDASQYGLEQVHAVEKGGLVYVNQTTRIEDDELNDCPDFFQPEQSYFEHETVVDKTNWKLLAETTMEGYHIKGLHKDTFYPYGYDNTTVVELFGPHSRIVFPFQRINKLRGKAASEYDLGGAVTKVYNLFPNAVVSILSKHTTLAIFEPIAPNKTEMIMYRVANLQKDGTAFNNTEAQHDADFVKGTGLDEDREAAVQIQETLESDHKCDLTFGLFEQAIVHFHQHLDQRLALKK